MEVLRTIRRDRHATSAWVNLTADHGNVNAGPYSQHSCAGPDHRSTNGTLAHGPIDYSTRNSRSVKSHLARRFDYCARGHLRVLSGLETCNLRLWEITDCD